VCGVGKYFLGVAIAPNSSALNGLRKGRRVGFFRPAGQKDIFLIIHKLSKMGFW